VRPDIVPGAVFPDYELPDHSGVLRKPSALQGAEIHLWHDLRAATREIRPDWDLSEPGLREAWDAGDLSRFHGWNKRARTESLK
jgi:hypothetical protein